MTTSNSVRCGEYARQWTRILRVFVVFWLLPAVAAATVIHVDNPGEGRDIRPDLEAAFDRAGSGDTVLLPAGSFRFSGSIVVLVSRKPDIRLKGAGAGLRGTRLYRGDIETNEPMIRFQGERTRRMKVEVSGIWFQGKRVFLDRGLEDAWPHDRGLLFMGVNAYVHDCKFQWFAYSAVAVSHPVQDGMAVICDNEFVDNVTRTKKGGFSAGYGVSVSGSPDRWAAVTPGTDMFVFIEDNTFSGHRHAVGGAQCGLYVFRHNRVERSANTHAVDLHGARRPDMNSYRFSCRFAEVYRNTIIATPSSSALGEYDHCAIGFRGGEGLVWGNTFRNWRHPVKIMVEHCWHQQVPTGFMIPEYPVPYQVGYESGKSWGKDHAGADPEVHGKGDVFVWENLLDNCGALIVRQGNTSATPDDFPDVAMYVIEGRDYHRVRRPGYKPHPFPHPRRMLPAKADNGKAPGGEYRKAIP